MHYPKACTCYPMQFDCIMNESGLVCGFFCLATPPTHLHDSYISMSSINFEFLTLFLIK